MPAPTSYSHNLTVSLTLVLSLLGGGFTNAAPIDGYKVVARYPHSTDSYTGSL
jgi:hypothetical protein